MYVGGFFMQYDRIIDKAKKLGLNTDNIETKEAKVKAIAGALNFKNQIIIYTKKKKKKRKIKLKIYMIIIIKYVKILKMMIMQIMIMLEMMI